MLWHLYFTAQTISKLCRTRWFMDGSGKKINIERLEKKCHPHGQCLTVSFII